VTYGKTWEEAIENATDVLAGWLAHAEPEFVTGPSYHDDLKHLKGDIIPIQVDEQILESYQERKRFNVIFPTNILKKIDHYRKQVGMKRSTLLQKAAEEYLARHAA